MTILMPPNFISSLVKLEIGDASYAAFTALGAAIAAETLVFKAAMTIFPATDMATAAQ